MVDILRRPFRAQLGLADFRFISTAFLLQYAKTPPLSISPVLPQMPWQRTPAGGINNVFPEQDHEPANQWVVQMLLFTRWFSWSIVTGSVQLLIVDVWQVADLIGRILAGLA